MKWKDECEHHKDESIEANPQGYKSPFADKTTRDVIESLTNGFAPEQPTYVEKDHEPTHALPENAAQLLAVDVIGVNTHYHMSREEKAVIHKRVEARLSMWKWLPRSAYHFREGERVLWQEAFETKVTHDCMVGDEKVALSWPRGGQFWVPVGEVELL